MYIKNLILKLFPEFISERIRSKKSLGKIVNNINSLTAERFIRLSIGMFVSAVVARYLGPSEYGILSFATSFVALFGCLNGLGLKGIIVRNIVKHPEKKEQYLGSALLLKLSGAMLMIVLSISIYRIFLYENDLILYSILIVSTGYVFKSFDTIELWFQSQVQSKYTAYSRLISIIIISIIKIILVVTHQNVITFVVMFSLDFFIISLSLFIFYQQKGPCSILKWKIRFYTMKELLSNSWPLMLSGVATIIYMKIDQIMIGKMISKEALGIYSVSVKLSSAWYFVPGIIISSIFPSIVKTHKSNRELYLKRMQLVYDFFTLTTVSISILVTLFSKPIIKIIYGLDFIQASGVLSIHIWSGIFVFFGVANSKHLLLENLVKTALFRTVLGAISNIILNLILLPKYGVFGAAWATLISYAISSWLSNILFKETRIIFVMLLKTINLIKYIRKIKCLRK